MNEKKNCWSCKFRGTVPCSAHISCNFKWRDSELDPPKADLHGIRNGWYFFPLNFDPVWQNEKCTAYQKK